MKKNAALERKNKAMIVINNPGSPEKQAKLLQTVLQVRITLLDFKQHISSLVKKIKLCTTKWLTVNDKNK